MTTPGTQHYVWRHYLEAWQNEYGLVHCSRNGVILPTTNPRNLMSEREFYRLPIITRADADFLKGLFGSVRTAAPLRQLHCNLINQCEYISNGNELIQRSDRATAEEKHLVRNAVIKLEDKLHGQIEQNALPLLAELREKRAKFIHADKSAIDLFRFLAHQYFRTKRIRTAIKEELSRIDPNQDFGRLTNLVCHIGAENVGASLFEDRDEFDIVFLDDTEGVGFITGDQPIVNLMGTGDSRETTELVLYYPLTPDLSCLVVPKEHNLCSVQISGGVVDTLNDIVAWESRNFLVAKSNRNLESVISRQSSTKPPGRDILDSLAEATRLTSRKN